MRSILLFCTLCGLTLSLSAQAVTDTLEANVGAKARVLFLAETPADFAELSKYDLNALYSELYRREFGPDKNAMRLFDNEEASLFKRISSSKGFPLRLGFFAGVPLMRAFDKWVSEIGPIPENGDKPLATSSLKQGKVTGKGSLGVNLGIEKILIEREKYSLNLNAAIGFEWMGYKVQSPKSAIAVPSLTILDSFQIEQPGGFITNQYIYDTTAWSVYDFNSQPANGSFSHLFLEILPVIQLHRKNGKQGLKFGIGARFGPDLSRNNFVPTSALGRNGFVSVTNINGESSIPANPINWHLTWLTVIGYGKFNLQLSYVPKAVIQNSFYITDGFRKNLGWDDSGLLNIGLRYGL
jgi:hypothetical protein